MKAGDILDLAAYFGRWMDHPDATPARRENAGRLIAAVNALAAQAAADGLHFPINSATHTAVAGVLGGFGGFRPQSCPIGARGSAHKEGLAVDLFDPYGVIDDWLMNNQDEMAACGIYAEHPQSTVGWSHWTIRPPASGRRFFYP